MRCEPMKPPCRGPCVRVACFLRPSSGGFAVDEVLDCVLGRNNLGLRLTLWTSFAPIAVMIRNWEAMVLVVMGCSDVANPLYCDENSDCKNGTVCNLDTNGCEAADAAPEGDAPSDGPYVARRVQDVRAVTTPVDTPVELDDVIVTAVDLYGNRAGEFWVQQAGGGPQSGIHVFGAALSQVQLLAVGDVVDLTGGRKAFYAAASDTSGRVEIEIIPNFGQSLSVVKTGMTATPVLTTINLTTLGTLTGPELDAAREEFVGAFVRVGPAQATSDVTDPPDPSFREFVIGPFRVSSNIAEFPPGIALGTCFESIRGVLEYRINYNIHPRFTSDVVTTACP